MHIKSSRIWATAGLAVLGASSFGFIEGNIIAIRATGTDVELNEFTINGTPASTVDITSSLTGSTINASLTGDRYGFDSNGNGNPSDDTPSYAYFSTDSATSGQRLLNRVNRETNAIQSTDITGIGASVRAVTFGDDPGEFFLSNGTAIYRVANASFSGDTQAATSLASGNFRYINFFSGDLYVSTGSTNPALGGVNRVDQTTGALTQIVSITGVGGSGAADFLFTPDMSTLYVASEITTQGLLKYTLSGGTYSLAETITIPTVASAGGNTGLRGLAFDGTSLFATTTESLTSAGAGNRIVRIVDTAAGADITTLATSASGSFYRSVEAVPEPASMAILGLGLAGLMARRRRK